MQTISCGNIYTYNEIKIALKEHKFDSQKMLKIYSKQEFRAQLATSKNVWANQNPSQD